MTRPLEGLTVSSGPGPLRLSTSRRYRCNGSRASSLLLGCHYDLSGIDPRPSLAEGMDRPSRRDAIERTNPTIVSRSKSRSKNSLCEELLQRISDFKLPLWTFRHNPDL